jgi:hypothetical protein
LGRRTLEAVIISLACAGALWLFQNPVGAGELIDQIVALIGQVGRGWVTAIVWVAGILLALAVGIALLGLTEPGSAWSVSAGPIAGVALVFGLTAISLSMCAGGNAWGLVPAGLAVWTLARLAQRLRRAWVRFWRPGFI